MNDRKKGDRRLTEAEMLEEWLDEREREDPKRAAELRRTACESALRRGVKRAILNEVYGADLVAELADKGAAKGAEGALNKNILAKGGGLLIEATGLEKRFGDIVAVDGISLEVAKGEVLGFLGPNGAGKSTTMKMLTGFLEPDAGSARIAGIDVFAAPRQAKRVLGYLPEGAPCYADMRVAAFLDFIAEIRGFEREEARRRVAAAVEKTELEKVLDQRIETLSKGFKRRVAIAQAILHDPQVLIMDEPTDGLDPNQKHHVRKLISDMAADKAIIVSTHILEEVEAVCSRAVIINKGRIVANGTAEDLMRRLPYHNTIALKVATGRAEAVTKALAELAAIAKVERVGAANGRVQLRAVPGAGAPAPPELAALIRGRLIEAEEVVVERGNLDEVFRQITTSETAPHA